VIIRSLAEGRYDVDDGAMDRLNELDTPAESAVQAGDEEALASGLAALYDEVRARGTAHAADSLDESDLILPPPGASIEEVRDLLGDDGLIPG